jgi:hypothetical protein
LYMFTSIVVSNQRPGWALHNGTIDGWGRQAAKRS